MSATNFSDKTYTLDSNRIEWSRYQLIPSDLFAPPPSHQKYFRLRWKSWMASGWLELNEQRLRNTIRKMTWAIRWWRQTSSALPSCDPSYFWSSKKLGKTCESSEWDERRLLGFSLVVLFEIRMKYDTKKAFMPLNIPLISQNLLWLMRKSALCMQSESCKHNCKKNFQVQTSLTGWCHEKTADIPRLYYLQYVTVALYPVVCSVYFMQLNFAVRSVSKLFAYRCFDAGRYLANCSTHDIAAWGSSATIGL